MRRRGPLAALAALAALAPVPAGAAQDDGLCTGAYGDEPARPGAPVRFGIDSELAGDVGTGQSAAVPLDWDRDREALTRLRPDGRQLVLRVNRLFWADGEKGIARFSEIVERHAAAGFDSEIQVRYHPAEGDEGDIDAWTAYVRHVVDVLGANPRVLSMTITNEVNLDVSPNTSDGAYEGAREALIEGIVAAREEADRIGRTDLQLGFTYAYRWNPRSDAAFWTALAAGGERFRRAVGFVGIDVYPGTFYPPVVSPASSPGREVVKALATVRRCYMPKAQLGDDVPLWVTENGYGSGVRGDDAAQADALDDMAGAVVAHAGTYNVSDYRWFNLRDNVTGSPAFFSTSGLMRDDYSEKPAFARYRARIAAHGAARAPECVDRVTLRLPRGTRRYAARLDGRRVRGRRHGRRLTVTLRRAGRRRVVVRAGTPRGLRVLRRTVVACGMPRATRPARAARATASAARPRTVVSLEFDVGTADQRRALPLLARHGMSATFFVNSGFIGKPGHLTYRQLRHMQAVGHEIAGQTTSHARLPGLPRGRVRREVCGDRRALLVRGLAVDAFAYPYGAYSSAVRDVVVRCGYSSARLASGIAGAGKVCGGCPYAETLPPHNRFATRMPAAVQRTTTFARLQEAVRDAQRSGGGWVQLLMHHVCEGCHRYAISPARLRRLLAWLDGRDGVAVRTVAQLLDAGGPTVRIRAPARFAPRTTLRPVFRAPAGVRRVRYFVDGRQVGVRSIAPWRLRWIPTGLRPGRHDVRALLEDARGNAALSPRVVVASG